MEAPQIGDKVHVWPMRGNVQASETAFESFLAPDGADVVWSVWWHCRYRDGDIVLHDPRAGRDGRFAAATGRTE